MNLIEGTVCTFFLISCVDRWNWFFFFLNIACLLAGYAKDFIVFSTNRFPCYHARTQSPREVMYVLFAIGSKVSALRWADMFSDDLLFL